MPSYTFAKPYYNVASAANTIACEEAWNVYFEAMPQGGYAIRRRPGMSKINQSDSTLTSGRGVYWSDRNGKFYCGIDGDVYVKPGFNSDLTLIGTMTDHKRSMIFAEGQKLDLTDIIYIANGSTLEYIDSSTDTLVTPTDLNTPTSTFISMMNNRFYANDLSHGQDFLITDVDPDTSLMDVTYWSSAVNPFRAAQKPDDIRGIYTGWNEIYIWGSMACEVWQEDGVTPVSPLVGSLMEIGLEAPYSVVMANNTMFALCVINGKRSVISVQGRAPNVISEAIALPLQKYSTVSDAVGSLCFVGGLNMYILSFPTEQATWAYDFKTETWSQWSSWDRTNGIHKMFQGRYGAYAKAWNKHIIQGGDGSLYEFSRSVYSDDGTPIRSSIRTGWLDHGTWDRKRSDQLIIKLQGYASSDAKILMRWRSDGFPEWSTPMELPIQAGQQNDHFCKLNRMGMYRSRQYEFIMTDASDLALIGMEEDLTRMRN